MQKIYILLPVHNRKKITNCFIECLKRQRYTNYHLVLIDDGSDDGTSEMVLENIPMATVLRGTGDWWWAKSLQRGLNWVKKQSPDDNSLVLFINDDVSFEPDYLENAARLMKNKTGTLVLSRLLDKDSNQPMESGITVNLGWLKFDTATSHDQINCLSTRGLFASWLDVEVIGGFNYKLLPHYLSDYEYTIRAYKKGIKCETSKEILIQANFESTGYHVHREEKISDLLKNLFSRKSPHNPVYMSLFVVLVVKPVWVLPNLARIWIRVAVTILKAALGIRHEKV